MVAVTAGAGAVSSSIIVTSQRGLHGCSIVYPKVSSAISRGCSRVIFAETVTERSPGMLGSLVWAYARAGRRSDALRLVEELRKRQHTGYVPADAFLNSYLGSATKTRHLHGLSAPSRNSQMF
jgi:hypothetical protein